MRHSYEQKVEEIDRWDAPVFKGTAWGFAAIIGIWMSSTLILMLVAA